MMMMMMMMMQPNTAIRIRRRYVYAGSRTQGRRRGRAVHLQVMPRRRHSWRHWDKDAGHQGHQTASRRRPQQYAQQFHLNSH